jgi:transcription elongation GreA/GreB family factor
MSRAFTREIDDAPPPPVPERAVSAARNLVTRQGARQIEEMIATLTGQLEAGGETLALSALRRDLRYWDARRATMEIVEPSPHPTVVRFATTVVIQRNGKASRIRIVGEDEADPSSGAIAWTSPLAQALEGAGVGEIVEFDAAGRDEEISVLSIESENP